MDIELMIGVVSVLAGVFVLVAPKLLNYVVAIYLIAYGILTLIQL